jgi:high-affinity Fe2+/Pb2+ permease
MLATAGALALGYEMGHPELFVMGIGLFIGAVSAALLVGGIRKLEQPPSVDASRQIMKEEIEWAKGKLAETKSSSSPET